MNRQCGFDNSAKEYLYTFYGILDEMIWCMTGAELGESISYNFIVQMIPHHQAAIEMSKNILKYTDNKDLRKIATGIIEEQTKSIRNMQRIRECCCRMKNSGEDLRSYQSKTEKIMREMFSGMKSACASNRVSCSFMWEMIPHHEGAVRMSENALCYSVCQELVPILQAIITSQKRGIRQMKELLRCMGC